MADFYAGHGGRATIGGTIYKVTSWAVTLTTQLLKFTNSDSGGWEEWETGIQGGEFAVNFNFAVGTTPGNALMNHPGVKANVELALTGATKTIDGTGAISELKVFNEVEGLVPCIVTGKFTYGYTLTDF